MGGDPAKYPNGVPSRQRGGDGEYARRGGGPPTVAAKYMFVGRRAKRDLKPFPRAQICRQRLCNARTQEQDKINEKPNESTGKKKKKGGSQKQVALLP